MSIYSLPKFEISLKPKKNGGDSYKSILFIAVIVSLVFGFLGGFTGYYLLSGDLDRVNVSSFSNDSGVSTYTAQTVDEAKTIQSIKDVKMSRFSSSICSNISK
ncbi:MAG: hypothetical protein NT148_00210 [Candidatus Nealsonbacteria bacterium]|nr:hypothetical protein [Candidatus Nealsonbacteria bacterium]